MSESDNSSHDAAVGSPFFEAWARFIIRARFLVLGLTLAATAAIAQYTNENLRVDNSVEVFIPDGSPTSEALEEYRDEFGRDGLESPPV